MNSARRLIEALYTRFPGRTPVKVGLTAGFGAVFPFVFEDENERPIGLVGCGWSKGQAPNFVQIYHASAFRQKSGAGTKIMRYLCDQADSFGVELYVQAQPQYVDIETSISEDKLNQRYGTFGFRGYGALTRSPNAI